MSGKAIMLKGSALILYSFLVLLQCEFQSVLCDSNFVKVKSGRSFTNNCQDLNVQIVTNKVSSSSSSGSGSRSSSAGNSKQKLYYEQNGQLLSQAVGTDGEFSVLMYGPEPIQWMYEGPGEAFSHSATTERSKSGCYVIKLVRSPNSELKAENTGRYVVKSKANPARKESIYLYVPNKYPPFLLNTERLQTVDWEEGKPLVLPCLLNDPSVKVALSKRVGLNEWQEVNNVGTYHPQVGFTIRKPFNGATTLYGSYKCFTSLHNRNDTVFMYVAPAGY